MDVPRQRIVLMLFLIMTVVMAACGARQNKNASFTCDDALGCVTIRLGEPIKLGSVQALTGGAAPIGQTQDRVIRFAIQDHGGTLLGHPIMLQSEDTGCTFEGGANAALRLAADPQLLGIIGTACSGAASGAVPIMSKANLVMISGANTAPALTALNGEQGTEWQPGYFRAIYNGDQIVRAAAQFVYDYLGLRKVATVNDGDTFSRGLTRSFETAFRDLNGTITLSLTINKGDENMRPALEAIAFSQPELVFLPIFQPEADFLMAQTRTVPELIDMPFMGVESLLVNGFIHALDPDITLYFVTSSVITEPASRALAERYRTEFGTPPHTTFRYAYDATNLLLYAIEIVAVQDADGTLHIGRQALRDTLYGIRDFVGLEHTYRCDTFGDCSTATFYIVQVDDPAAGLDGVLANTIASYDSALH